MQNKTAAEAIRGRQTTCHFSSRRVPDQILYELLELANLAPSSFNLQPWHFIVVRDSDLREVLSNIALQQEQVMTAPCTVVFAADPLAWRAPYQDVLDRSVAAGVIDSQQAALYRRYVNNMFSTDPFGLFGMIKRIMQPMRRLFRPAPRVITSREEAREYVRAQTMLAASVFLVAASAAGLGTCPIERFDEDRLKKLLAIPGRMAVPLVVAVGYPLEEEATPAPVRLPLVDKLSVDLFPNKLSKLKK